MKYRSIILLFVSFVAPVFSYAETALQVDRCSKDSANECMTIADDLFEREQFDEALKYYQKLCVAGVGKGCRREGWIHTEVFYSELELTREMYRKACSLNDMIGCSNLGLQYQETDEMGEANTLYLQACDANEANGCSHLAASYRWGWGVDVDYEKSSDLYVKSCKLDLASACDSAGDVFYYEFANYKTALKWYDQACKLNFGEGCYNLGYQYEKGEGTKKKVSKAYTFYKKACDMSYARGCTAVARAYVGDDDADGSKIKKDYKKGITLFERSCNMGHGRGCFELGYAYQEGSYRVNQDLDKALTLYQYGCSEVNDYSGLACYNAGWYHEAGVVVAPNIDLAKLYYQRGCEDDSSKACSNLTALSNPLFIDDSHDDASAKTVFITQKQFNGDLGGSIGADQKCQAEADDPTSKVQGKVFKAWISGSRQNESSDISRALLRSKSPYQLVDGSLVARSFKQLVGSGPDRAIKMFANGKVSKERFVLYTWTGLSDRGEVIEGNCSNWHSSSADNVGSMGNASGDSKPSILWSGFYEEKCSEELSLYCFEQ